MKSVSACLPTGMGAPGLGSPSGTGMISHTVPRLVAAGCFMSCHPPPVVEVGWAVSAGGPQEKQGGSSSISIPGVGRCLGSQILGIMRCVLERQVTAPKKVLGHGSATLRGGVNSGEEKCPFLLPSGPSSAVQFKRKSTLLFTLGLPGNPLACLRRDVRRSHSCCLSLQHPGPQQASSCPPPQGSVHQP